MMGIKEIVRQLIKKHKSNDPFQIAKEKKHNYPIRGAWKYSWFFTVLTNGFNSSILIINWMK
jgi:hypothetical protein